MNPEVLRNLIATLPGKRILILGDVILDEYLWGDVRRISPEAPVPIVEIRARSFVPGGAGNAAANIVSLSGQAYLGAVVGPDRAAEQLEEALRQLGVETSGLIADSSRSTTTKTRLLASSQQVVRMDSEHRTPVSPPVALALLRWVEQQLPNADACILSDYGKGVVTEPVAEAVIRAARQAGKPIIVDPKGTNYAKYRGATVVKPNIHEVQQVLKSDIEDEQSLYDGSRRLLDLLDGAALLVTRGAEGMSLFRANTAPVHIDAVARRVFDVTGAGDTVVSTLALALAAGAALEPALHLANVAAGIVVGKRGTATVTLDELREAVALTAGAPGNAS